MSYPVICLASFLAAGLTLFSGFGLGTLLLPVFAVFFPVEAAVGLTAVVHLLNNLFKLALLGKKADGKTVLRFGLPAVLAAFAGARALVWLSGLGPLARYQAFGREFSIMPVKSAVALLMVSFALTELLPSARKKSFDKKYLPWGGILSGFFGGLSGHQGALRSAFLIRCGLSKEGFIATGVAVACLVDLSRLAVYAARFPAASVRANAALLAAAALSAFLGVWTASRFLDKITIRAVQLIVAVLLLLIAAGLGAGVI